MNMSSDDYSWFVLIPNLPNIPLPLFIGPLVMKIGARTAFLIFNAMLSLGMITCIISVNEKSIILIILGKTIFQIAVECLGICHGKTLSFTL